MKIEITEEDIKVTKNEELVITLPNEPEFLHFIENWYFLQTYLTSEQNIYPFKINYHV